MHHLLALPIEEQGVCIEKAGEMRRDMWIPRIPVRLQLPITGALFAELLVLGVSSLAIGGREKDAGQKVGCR